MHSNRVLLVEAESPENAIEKVETFLEPYDDSRVYDYYVYGGRWSWATDLHKKYYDKIVKKGTTYYWNEYSDPAIMGKQVLVEFPDGTSKYTTYGMNVENALRDWIDAHPTWSEVMRGDDKRFLKVIKGAAQTRFSELKRERDCLINELLPKERRTVLQAEREATYDAEVKAGKRKDTGWIGNIPYNITAEDMTIAKERLFEIITKTDVLSEERYGMPTYYISSIVNKFSNDSFDDDSYFFDIDDYSNTLSKEKAKKIQENPTGFYIVNLDTHN
jgi:hypothetical protein